MLEFFKVSGVLLQKIAFKVLHDTQLTLPVNLVLNHHGTCSLYFVWGEFEYTPLCNMVDSLKLVLDLTIWKPHM